VVLGAWTNKDKERGGSSHKGVLASPGYNGTTSFLLRAAVARLALGRVRRDVVPDRALTLLL
jgi:hypothetical protein